MAFTPARCAALPTPALTAYLNILTALFDSLTPNEFEGTSQHSASAAVAASADNDFDDESRPALTLDYSIHLGLTLFGPAFKILFGHAGSAVFTFSDPETLGRNTETPFCMLLALEGRWPRKTSTILGAIVIGDGSGTSVIKELWRGSSTTDKLDTSIPSVLSLVNLHARARFSRIAMVMTSSWECPLIWVARQRRRGIACDFTEARRMQMVKLQYQG
ncbi:hypothetical protein B0H13DRAFT_2520641 [Mycena leptocephala]|nr:hypothetical protein B0H13DRAFT_2520641 [Mycena leptocephala]